jgi:hypothetical protein
MEEIKYKVKLDTKEVDKAGGALRNFTNKAKENFKGVASGVNDFGEKLTHLPGTLGTTASAFKGLSTQMMAFIANPVGAVIAALVAIFFALKGALEKSEKGMDAMGRVAGIFGAIINPIIQAISELAALLVDGLATALEFVGEMFGASAKEGRKLADIQDELEDRELSMAEARAKGNKELAQAREILSDSNASLADRKKALEEVRKSETLLAAQELKFAQDKLAAARLDQKLNGETEESKKAISAAVVKVMESETELAAKNRLFNKEAKKLNKEEEDQKKEFAKAEEDRQKDLAEKRKQYADERKTARDKIREAENKNLIDSIQDEEKKARKQAEIDYANSLREIELGKYTRAEKKKLEEAAKQANVLKLAQIQATADKKALDDKKKHDDEIKAFDQKSADDEAKAIDAAYARREADILKSITNEKDRQDALYNLEVERLKNQIQARKDAGLITTDLDKALAQKEIDNAKDKADKKKELDQKEFDTKVAIANATTNVLSSINGVLGENAEFGKAIAVSQAVIDTYAGATKALAQGGTLGFVGAAAVVAAGLANVQKILSTDVPKAEGQSGGSGGGMPSVSMVSPQSNSNLQLAGVLNGQNKKPTRAYVVGQDINSQQSLDRHIKQNATF